MGHRFIIKILLSLLLVMSSWALAELRDVSADELASDLITKECQGRLTDDEITAAKSKWRGKTVVFDTNVLINDPYAIFKYPGAKTVLPATVIEELDDKKSDDRNGRVVRTFFRIFDELMRQAIDPMKPIQLPHDAELIVDSWDHMESLGKVAFDRKKNDNRIIATAKALADLERVQLEKNKGKKKNKDKGIKSSVYLISDDRSVRIKSASLGVQSLPFEYEWIDSGKNVEQTLVEHELSQETLSEFLEKGFIPKPEGLKIAPNQFVMLRSPDSESGPDSVARYYFDRENPAASGLRRLTDLTKLNLPFNPKNLEQHMALDVLLDPTVDLVIMEANAGTGKSFVALLASLSQISRPGHQGLYNSLMITRPLVDVGGGNRLGALPGDVTAKLEQDFNAFYDNISLIWSKMKGSRTAAAVDKSWMDNADPNDLKYTNKERKQIRYHQQRLQRKKEQEEKTKEFLKAANAQALPPAPVIERFKPTELRNLELLPFMKMRGRSLHYTFLIADEFQNTSIHEAKTILTRAGIGSKFVLIGDTAQIDLPFLNERNNGLSVTIKLFTSDDLTEEQRSRVAFVRLVEGVRSPLSELSVDRFSRPIPQ